MNWDQLRTNCNHLSDRLEVIWAEVREGDFTTIVNSPKLVPVPIESPASHKSSRRGS